MKAVVLTCFESNEERVGFVHETLKRKNYDVKCITSDFSHIKKKHRDSIPDGFISIPTQQYKKNLSFARLKSHYQFSIDSFKEIERIKPDLLWIMAPANSLIKQANIFKKKYPSTKIVLDIIDMWPESLPVNINKNVFPLNIWKNLRKKNIGCADYLVTECDYYKEILNFEYDKSATTIRWCRDEKADGKYLGDNEKELQLCYIGSINNILDPKTVAKSIKKIDMPVKLHVIGEGENVDNFIIELSKTCEVVYYGPIRDEKRKKDIFSKCHAGINLYKENLYIGLTVKCIDYFKNGLPIINNIKGDTSLLLKKYSAGINVNEVDVISGNQLIKLRKNNQNILQLFNENFTKSVFVAQCHEVIDKVMR